VTTATKYIITTQVQNNSTAPTVVTLQQANAEGKWLTLATDEVYATKDVSIEVTPNFSSPMRLSYSLRKGLATDNITVASINYIRVDKQASSRLVILCNTDADFSDDYRYGFNGQEKDNEVKGVGNSINYKARIYDDRLGKFLSVDPLTQHYPWYTPYQFAGNTPIQAIDMDGLEEYIVVKKYDINTSFSVDVIKKNPVVGMWETGSVGLPDGTIDQLNNSDRSALEGAELGYATQYHRVPDNAIEQPEPIVKIVQKPVLLKPVVGQLPGPGFFIDDSKKGSLPGGLKEFKYALEGVEVGNTTLTKLEKSIINDVVNEITKSKVKSINIDYNFKSSVDLSVRKDADATSKGVGLTLGQTARSKADQVANSIQKRTGITPTVNITTTAKDNGSVQVQAK
jgi:RHS repeat-associated protein